MPYVIGIAGSVGVGKSTTAEVLQALISLWPGRPRVDLVSTDGFLYPNRLLRSRGLLDRKGFPESYDLPLLLRFLADVKSGRAEVSAPIHSHLTYDIIPDQAQIVRRPEAADQDRASRFGITPEDRYGGRRREHLASWITSTRSQQVTFSGLCTLYRC